MKRLARSILSLSSLVPVNYSLVSTLAGQSDNNIVFKAEGNVLEVSFGKGKDSGFYKINEHGLTDYAKVVENGSFTESIYVWSK